MGLISSYSLGIYLEADPDPDEADPLRLFLRGLFLRGLFLGGLFLGGLFLGVLFLGGLGPLGRVLTLERMARGRLRRLAAKGKYKLPGG